MNHLVVDVNTADFEAQVLQSDTPVLVEFTADWCPPCKMLAPIIHELAEKYNGSLRIAMLNSDTNPQVTQDYSVFGLPTLLLFVDGEPVERIVGFKPLDRIETKLLPHLTKDPAS